MRKTQLIIVGLLIVPCILMLAVDSKAQVDSAAVRDTLSQANADTTQVDSLAVDSLEAAVDSVNAFEKAYNLQDVQYPFDRQIRIKLKQKPLPNPEKWSITDTTDLGAEYFKAIEERFSIPVVADDSLGRESLFRVVGPDDTLQSLALIEGYPYLRSYVNYHKRLNSLGSKELKELKDSLAYHFEHKVKIHLILRSYNIRAMKIDTSRWDVRLTAGSISLPPNKILRLPVKTEVWGKLVWYRRKILLSFPRFVGANDLVYDPRLGLRIKMRNHSTDSTVYKANYVVKFTNIIEGGATYKQ